MKLIIAIIRDELSDPILECLIESDFRVTRIASTGGFLRRGMTTLMIGVDNDRVDQAIQLIGETCDPITNQNSHNVTLFVLKVDQFLQV
ncbi:MAG: cyclic-di-AMP receptor [Anaerolineales bacterium]